MLGNRKVDLENLAATHGAQQALTVLTNQHTLEHEILGAGNEGFLKGVFLRLHRNSRRDWTDRIEGVPVQDRPDAFLKLIEAKKTRKRRLGASHCFTYCGGRSVCRAALSR